MSARDICPHRGAPLSQGATTATSCASITTSRPFATASASTFRRKRTKALKAGVRWVMRRGVSPQ
ncbi:hypothetical protein [Paraburkholderia phytofirmans]|uniref:hypothetical protein n=1 Tax=Paraburkholderia phytofirmans TaxID=261302 RepID=UPI003B58732B